MKGRTKEDAVFSRMIRERDQWTCQRHIFRKLKTGNAIFPHNSSGLHAAHRFTRRTRATRFLPENAMACCYGCHQYIDSHPEEKEALFVWKFGQETCDAVAAIAHGKRDRV